MQKNTIIEWESIYIYTKHERTELFNDINLSVRKRDWISIIGHNGSGKSTLASTISGHYSDRYHVEGKHQFRKRSTYPMLIQMTSEYLLGATPYEDLIIAYEQYGSERAEGRHIEEEIDAVLEKLHISHLKHSNIATLSGGEKQLVALAGCLMMKAELVIFDEMTSMLAPETKEHILLTIRELWEQEAFAVIWITQSAEELKYSDRVWVMQDRKLVYDGNAAELYSAEQEPSLASQLNLHIPWAVIKAQQLRLEGVTFAHIPFHVAELVRLVKQNDVSNAK